MPQTPAVSRPIQATPTAKSVAEWLVVTNPTLWAVLGLIAGGGLNVAALFIRARERSGAAHRVTVFTHDDAVRNPTLPIEVRKIFQEAGWQVMLGHTNLPEHSEGVWVRGAGKFEKAAALWALSTLSINGQIDESGDIPSLQVIVGAWNAPTKTYSGDEAMEDIRSNQAIREYPIVVAERDSLKVVLEATQQERETLRGELGGMQQAWLTCKQQFALARLSWFAEKIDMNIAMSRAENREVADIHVTIRFTPDYADYPLAQKIESILRGYTKWQVTLDGRNDPILRPHTEYKVIFVSSAAGTFDSLHQVFADGRLIDAPTAYRHDNHFDTNRLVIDVLPTMKAS